MKKVVYCLDTVGDVGIVGKSNSSLFRCSTYPSQHVYEDFCALYMDLHAFRNMSAISTDHKMWIRRLVGAPRPPPVTQQPQQLTHSRIVIFKCPVNVHDYIGFCCMDTKTLLANCITFCPLHKYIRVDLHDFLVRVNWAVCLSTNTGNVN